MAGRAVTQCMCAQGRMEVAMRGMHTQHAAGVIVARSCIHCTFLSASAMQRDYCTAHAQTYTHTRVSQRRPPRPQVSRSLHTILDHPHCASFEVGDDGALRPGACEADTQHQQSSHQ